MEHWLWEWDAFDKEKKTVGEISVNRYSITNWEFNWHSRTSDNGRQTLEDKCIKSKSFVKNYIKLLKMVWIFT